MRLIALGAALGLFVVASAPSLAKGTIRIQHSNGDTNVYQNVGITVVHRTLRITSADGKGTLIVSQAACSYAGKLERCSPERVTLEQGGATKPINISSGTIYVNPTDDTQTLSLSSTQLPPHGILLIIRTKIDTYISMSGQIDGLVR